MPETLNVLLSREELLFLLYVLKTDFIPGLDADPLGNLTNDQKKLSLVFAERALRARELAGVDPQGGLVVREALMLLIATCAYSDLMISAHHFPSNQAPQQAFWHVRSGVVVLHTRPEAPLHHFAFVPDRAILQQQIFDSCHLAQLDECQDYPEIITTHAVLKTAREGAGQNKSQTIEMLVSNGIATEAAAEISNILSGEHTATTLHLAALKTELPPLQESVTILSGPTSTWLMKELEPDKVSLQVTHSELLLGLLQHWLENTPWPDVAGIGQS
jgi:hypothetical protein